MTFIETLKVIFLGIIEGITEWLPISSTGHMLLVDEFFKLKATDEFKELFFVVIQLGAILAVILLFWKKMWPFGITNNKLEIKKDIFINSAGNMLAAIKPQYFNEMELNLPDLEKQKLIADFNLCARKELELLDHLKKEKEQYYKLCLEKHIGNRS